MIMMMGGDDHDMMMGGGDYNDDDDNDCDGDDDDVMMLLMINDDSNDENFKSELISPKNVLYVTILIMNVSYFTQVLFIVILRYFLNNYIHYNLHLTCQTT